MAKLWEVFYSWRHKIDKEESRYQIKIPHWVDEDGEIILGGTFHLTVDSLFIKRVYSIRRFWLSEFLEYQYNKCTGKKIDFLEYTEEIIDKHIKRRHSTNPRDKFIFDWIEKKKQELNKKNKTHQKNSKSKNKSKEFSHKQIAIAFRVMGISITKENAATILIDHAPSTNSIEKLLQKRIGAKSSLSQLSENKSTDTKKLQDLKAAKRLISGIKNQPNINEIDTIIKAFETAYEKHY